MKPIRTDQQAKVVQDGWGGKTTPIQESGTEHLLTDTGAIHSQGIDRRTACACGCLNEPGGFCADCGGGVICVECFCRCSHCQRPICGRHSTTVDDSKSGSLRLCSTCHGTHRRRGRLGRVMRFVFSPFIEFNE